MIERNARIGQLLVFITALVIGIGILVIPIDSIQLVTIGYGGVFVVALVSAASLFIPGPSMVVAFTAGAKLNPLIVSLVAATGSAIGETTSYGTGFGSKSLISNRMEEGSWYKRIFEWIRGHAFLTIFVLAAIPNFLTDMSGLIAGRIGYPFPRFLLATFLGKVVRFGVSAYLGARILGNL